MSNEPRKAKPADTQALQMCRAFSILSEHSEASVVLLSHRGGLFVRFDGGNDTAYEMLRAACTIMLPNKANGEASMQYRDTPNEGD